MFYIYILKTTKCQKMYVGITNNPTRRLRQHKSVAKHKFKTLTKCGKAVRRYGAETFTLIVKAEAETKEEAARLEKEWIHRIGLRRLWNSSKGGEYKR